jgi:hypothetical protein
MLGPLTEAQTIALREVLKTAHKATDIYKRGPEYRALRAVYRATPEYQAARDSVGVVFRGACSETCSTANTFPV